MPATPVAPRGRFKAGARLAFHYVHLIGSTSNTRYVMGIFGNLMAKIMGHEARASEAKVNSAVAANAPAQAGATASAPAQPVDVEAVLEGMAASNSQKLDWRNSIVDLMKLVGIDSGLEARKSMAHELGYTGSTDDSATMNIWLHKEVMRQLAANGGKVPANLLS